MGRTSQLLLLCPVGLLTQVAAVAMVMVLLRAGKGAYNIKAKKLYIPDEYIAFVNTTNYSSQINGTMVHGLHDLFDFNKTKDFFVIYAARYCSGIKVNGTWKIDFCSYGGKEFFDHRVWRVWGSGFVQPGGMDSKAPLTIFALLLTSFCLLVVNLFCSFGILYSQRSMLIASLVSTFVTSAVTTASAVITDRYAKELVTHTKQMKLAGSGRIDVKYGKVGNSLMWACAGCSITALILYLIVCVRSYMVSKEADATDTTEYNTLDEESHDLPSYGSQTTLVPQGRSDYSKEDSAYEPFRHQEATKS